MKHLFTLAISACIFAQDAALRFDHIGIRNGLSQSTVKCFLQDSDGFLWIGTQNGLNRYDGYQFKVYLHEPEDPQSIQGNTIWGLFQASDGSIWVGTELGACRMDPIAETFTSYPIGGKPVYSFEEKDGNIFIASLTEGVLKFSPERGTIEPFANAAGHCLGKAPDGSLLMGGLAGQIYQIGKDNITPVPALNQLQFESLVTDILNDGREGVWISFLRDGLIHFNLNTEEIQKFNTDNGLPSNEVSSLIVDRKGDLWATSLDAGIWQMTETGINHYSHNPFDSYSLNINRTFCMIEDRSGILWIGGNSGLNKVNPSFHVFKHLRAVPGDFDNLQNPRVKSVLFEPNGDLWIGTFGGGLSFFNQSEKKVHHFKHDPEDPMSLPGDDIFALEKDGKGNLWVGTYRDGYCLKKPDSNQFVRSSFEPQDFGFDSGFKTVLDFAYDEQGAMWIASSYGLFRDDLEGKIDHIKLPVEGRVLIRDILKQKDVGLWLSTAHFGLFLLDQNGQLTEFPDPLASRLYMTFLDSKGKHWLATNGKGLVLKQGDRFESMRAKFGLEEPVIYAVMEDRQKNLWLSSDHGLIRFEPESGLHERFTFSDGLQDNEFNSGAYDSLPTGILAFGGINGLTMFDPLQVTKNKHIPPIHLTNIYVRNEFHGNGLGLSGLEVSHEDNVLSFEVVALDFNNPGQNQFAYKLEGWDEDWVQAGNRRFFHYAKLSPGTYELKVKGSNNDGLWNNQPVRFKVQIHPPFYMRLPFYGLVLLLLAGLLWRREYSIKKAKRSLEKEVQLRTKALRNTNERLVQAQNKLTQVAHHEGMSDIAGEVMHQLGNTLNSIKVSSEIAREEIDSAPLDVFNMTMDLMSSNAENLPQFIAEDPRGQKIYPMLHEINRKFNSAKSIIVEEMDSVDEGVKALGRFIHSQQKFITQQNTNVECNVEDTVREALLFSENEVNSLNLNVEVESEITVDIRLPRTKLILVLHHLIRNAVRALADQNPINPLLKIQAWQEDNNLFMSVEDNGIGIENERLSSMFQSKNLGLHYCVNTLQSLEGTLDAESSGPGRGAKFTLTLPILPI